MIDKFSDLISSIENISVKSSRVLDSEFAVEIRIQESDVGWIALESLARFCSNGDLTLEVTATEKLRSLAFQISGEISLIPELMPELHELVFPPDSLSEHLVG